VQSESCKNDAPSLVGIVYGKDYDGI
jgi:hypothetical protein